MIWLLFEIFSSPPIFLRELVVVVPLVDLNTAKPKLLTDVLAHVPVPIRILVVDTDQFSPLLARESYSLSRNGLYATRDRGLNVLHDAIEILASHQELLILLIGHKLAHEGTLRDTFLLIFARGG